MKRRSFLATLGLSALFGKEVVKAATAVPVQRRLSATEVSNSALERERAISDLYRKHGAPGQPIHLRDCEPIGQEQAETIRALHWQRIGQFQGINPNTMGNY